MKQLGVLEQFAAQHDLLYQRDGAADRYVNSRDLEYRYAFARCWSDEGSLILWVGVNPAKGDTEKRRRPTLERCITWSKSWGASGLIFGNLFAARHNKPSGLRAALDPVGPLNDAMMRRLGAIADRTVVAWGNLELTSRSTEVVGLLVNPLCFGLTGKGQPRHPLYVPHATALEPWIPH